jgi:hypothetical protein
MIPPPILSPQQADAAFRRHCLNRDSTNLGLLRRRDYDGILITGQHSGTHWIKWMLSHALASRHDLPPPLYHNNASSNDLVGQPREHRRFVAATHTIAPYALEWGWARIGLPPYVVVVRDIRDVLISNYEKWRGVRYDVDFSTYVAGDPTGKAYVCDVWWYVHLLNRWGAVAGRFPAQTLVMTYEDFRRDALAGLTAIGRQFKLDLRDQDLAAGVAAGDKEIMQAHQDPSVQERPVRLDGHVGATFSPADTALLQGILERNLRHDFGYDYFTTPRGFQPSSQVERAAPSPFVARRA